MAGSVFNESHYRLAWMVCLLLLVGFLANSISSYYVSRSNVRHTITESSLPLTSDNIYSVIQRDLLRPIFISSMMANDAFLREWTVSGERDVEQMRRYLNEIRREYDTVTSFFVSEASRTYYYWDGILKQVAEGEPRDVWYFRVRDLEVPFEINVDYDMANRDAMTIFVNYRVFDFDGNYIGAAGTGLTVNRVNALIEEYQARFGREIYFVDTEGSIVVAPERSDLAAYGSLREVPGLSDHLDTLLQQRPETLSYERGEEVYFLNSRFVPELNWFLMVEQTEEQLLAPLRETLLLNIGLALLITAVVALISVTAINRHQQKLESRNLDLSRMNAEVERQKAVLEETARELESLNATLSAMNAEKDDFLGIVAHDLRNPLNGVLGFCEQIRLDLPAGETRLHAYLADIHRSGYEMLALIGDILDVSSIESFQGPVDLVPANWNQLARDVHDRLRSQAAAKGIRFDLRLDAGAEVDLLTRDTWVAVCLNNLVGNAIKYAPKNSEISIETSGGEGGCEVRVRDHGPGIRPEEIGRIFQKFQRLSSQPTGGEPSSGLGLYIVKKMCERLGATITVESQFGYGSCFTIRHPRHQSPRI